MYCIFLGKNFEDVEALTQIDLLRRAKVKVDIYGVGGSSITSRSGVVYQTEKVFNKAADVNVRDYEGILLPGGPGVDDLAKNEELLSTIKNFYQMNKLVFAICAAPLLLDRAGILDGKKYTCYPGTDVKSGKKTEANVVIDGNIITSRGVGTSLEAAIKLVEIIVSPAEAKIQAEKVLYQA